MLKSQVNYNNPVLFIKAMICVQPKKENTPPPFPNVS